jgi:hypothetical protein
VIICKVRVDNDCGDITGTVAVTVLHVLYVSVQCHHSDGSLEGKLSRCKLGSMDHRPLDTETVIYPAKRVDDVSLSLSRYRYCNVVVRVLYP